MLKRILKIHINRIFGYVLVEMVKMFFYQFYARSDNFGNNINSKDIRDWSYPPFIFIDMFWSSTNLSQYPDLKVNIWNYLLKPWHLTLTYLYVYT